MVKAPWLFAVLAPVLVACGGGDASEGPSPKGAESADSNAWQASERSERITGVRSWELKAGADGSAELFGRDASTAARVHAHFTVTAEHVLVEVDAPSAWRFEAFPGRPPAPAQMPKDVEVALAASAHDAPPAAPTGGLVTSGFVTVLRPQDGLLTGSGQALTDPNGEVALLCTHGVWGRRLLREDWLQFLGGVFNYMMSHSACQDPAGGVWDPNTDAEKANQCMAALRDEGGCANPQYLYNLLLDEVDKGNATTTQ